MRIELLCHLNNTCPSIQRISQRRHKGKERVLSVKKKKKKKKKTQVLIIPCCGRISFLPGQKTLVCSRKADGYKLWLLWKAKGHRGMEQQVDQAMDMARWGGYDPSTR